MVLEKVNWKITALPLLITALPRTGL
ncbi:hypothetical protein AAS21_gp182 [Pantoea phage vB_PagS_AAS21]|uniref:Uncharacterized protein n=1 Tax=Pantoea phage vB_PagS_AAS21 TaxID=2575261 RepID=A0A4Y5P1T3_9CAUD|nr:hypothetical protein AAS21_gp182 [Pantoea phage vB_PagS_AAS21]